MRVRVVYTVDIDAEGRRLIRQHYGKAGLATREEVRNWYRNHGETSGNIMLGDEALVDNEQSAHTV